MRLDSLGAELNYTNVSIAAVLVLLFLLSQDEKTKKVKLQISRNLVFKNFMSLILLNNNSHRQVCEELVFEICRPLYCRRTNTILTTFSISV